MSFNISLGFNTSPANQLTKSVSYPSEYSFTGTLKEGSSLVDPVVMVEHSGAITGVNYAHISSFGRYYYIKDIKSVHNNMWEISLHSDALSSFASQIKNCRAIVAKNENRFNMYLNDHNYRCYQNPRYYARNFPSGFSESNYSFVLALCAGKTQEGN